MRPLSQVDPWDGCMVCRRQAELGITPRHDWTHEIQTLRNDRVPAWSRGTDPKHEPPESSEVRKEGPATPDGKTGTNLFMCIPPDHKRDDLPTTVTPAGVTRCAFVHGGDNGPARPNVYVGVTDDMGNTVTLPCFDVQYVDGKVVVMAHRTGRPMA